jgi:N-acetylmuramoyl-L-alanine amidase
MNQKHQSSTGLNPSPLEPVPIFYREEVGRGLYLHNHILIGSNVEYSWSTKNRELLQNPDSIVIHYTASGDRYSALRYLTAKSTYASAHLLISREGIVYQLVDFTTQAWHCGKSQLLGNTNPNDSTIGIEMQNAGLLKEHMGCYYNWRGKKIPENQVVRLVNPQTGFHDYWQSFTEIQLQVLREVCTLLLKAYNLHRIVGHNEISLLGEIDPGPAFPMHAFKTLIYG